MNAKLMVAALAVAAGVAVAAETKKPADGEKAKAEAVKKEIAALEKEWGGCRCGYGLYNVNWANRFGVADQEIYDEAKIAALEKRAFEIRRRVCELAPDDAGKHVALGELLMYYGQERKDDALFKEALGHFQTAVGIYEKGRPGRELAAAMFWLADAQFALGDRVASRATIEKLVAKNIMTGGRRVIDWSAMARSALFYLKGNDFDAMRLPFDNGSKAFPEPKQAKYTDDFTPLGEVRLVLKGVEEGDPRVKLLKTKLARMGAKFASAAKFAFDIALDPSAPVDKGEGYELKVTGTAATIRARDLQGVLWGVVSALQLVRHEPLAIRRCEILDWPDAARRGWLNHTFDTGAEYLLFVKGNSCCYQNTPVDANCMTPLRTFIASSQANDFKSFGLTLYYGLKWISHCEQMAISEPRTLQKRIEICKRFAAMGAGVYFPFDDVRYPMLNVDKAKFGCGANCDAKHLNDIYLGVAKDYPDFKLIFCPPFYWGPDAPASYPEDRETYLKSIGEHLDPRVDVYWTGAQVKGYEKRKYQVEWFTKLTKHKPSIFQNVPGPHNFLDYMVDPIPWDKIHYDGFVNDIGVFHANANWTSDLCQLSTECDWLWNSKAYDGRRSIRNGVSVYVGQGVTDVLAEALDDISYFDKYRYGEVNVNIMYENAADLEKKLDHAKDCYARACAQAKKNGAPMYGRFGDGIRWAEKIVKAAKNPPDFLARYKGQIAETVKLAAAEAQVDTNRGDVVLTPTSLAGLVPSGGGRPNSRFVKYLRGAQTADSAVSFQLQCDPFPPTGDYTLTICGVQDETPEENQLAISVNGTVVYEGGCKFPHTTGKALFGEYGRRDFKIPFASLKRYNTITIRQTSPGYNKVGTPYLGVNYIVVRKESR